MRSSDPAAACAPAEAPRQMVKSVEVDGVAIQYAVSPGDGDRCLVLVHGRTGHRMWFHRVTPLLGPGWRLVALDLSGHGDSGRREAYRASDWAREVNAVAEQESDGRAVFVGHSMGGRVALVAATLRPDLTHGVVMLDSPIRGPGERPMRPIGPARPLVYSSREEAIARFRLAPEQPVPDANALRPVAEYSITESDAGWTWKFHQAGLPVVQDDYFRQCLARATVPIHYVYGARSPLVRAAMVERARAILPSTAKIVSVPNGYHHIVLDSPGPTASAIKELARDLAHL